MRKPRRVREQTYRFKTGREAILDQRRFRWVARLPPAYLCKVIKDDWNPMNDRGTFRAHCCNPNCDGFVINRFAAPWCADCNQDIPNEWKKWFWGIQTKKALKRLVKDVFAE